MLSGNVHDAVESAFGAGNGRASVYMKAAFAQMQAYK